MSESTNSDGTTCPTLTGPNNYEIWKLRITVKLCREKVLGIVLGTDAKPGAVPGSSTSATRATVSTIVTPDPEDVRKWTERDEKAHGIIQDHISNSLLIKTQSHTTAKDLYGALVKLHEDTHLASAFHLYQKMLDSTWDGISPIGDHIARIRTIESWLAGMKYTIDPRLLAFTLINSLPKTLEWKTFVSTTVNSIDQAKLTFDNMETWIVAEASRLNRSGNGPESSLNVKGNLNSGDWWCNHHKIATHNTVDCYSYQSWVKGLQEGKGRRGGRKVTSPMLQKLHLTPVHWSQHM